MGLNGQRYIHQPWMAIDLLYQVHGFLRGKVWQHAQTPCCHHEDDSTLRDTTYRTTSILYELSYFSKMTFPEIVKGGDSHYQWILLVEWPNIPSSVFACPHPSLKRTHTTTDGYGAKYFSMASKWNRMVFRKNVGHLLIPGKLVNMCRSKTWHGKEWKNISLAKASVNS